jgi:hypothetical protein
MTKPITYMLQFRGQASQCSNRLHREARAPGCKLVTELTPGGLRTHFVWAPDDDEALFESTARLVDETRFEERGRIVFGHGHALDLRGHGQLVGSPAPHLRQGVIVWQISGGAGQFREAAGCITSNLLLSDTGEVTEQQLGVIFGRHGPAGDLPGSVRLGSRDLPEASSPVRRRRSTNSLGSGLNTQKEQT